MAETPASSGTIEFGADPNETIGVVQSCTINSSVETAEARDEKGKVIEQRAYSKTEERQYEALFKVGTEPPAAGTEIVDGNWKGLVTASNKTKTNTDYVKISITAQHKDSATHVIYS